MVGLTGGIASGKSSVAKIFNDLGVNTVNADLLAREAVEPGQAALQAIADHFGSKILLPDGTLDRASLRKIIFSQSEQKDWLEALLHPLIAALMRTRILESPSPYCILESPLLLETEQHKLVDKILVVDVARETQMKRAMERDKSDASVIQSIIASQLSKEERIERADELIKNEGSLKELRKKVEILHHSYLALANSQ